MIVCGPLIGAAVLYSSWGPTVANMTIQSARTRESGRQPLAGVNYDIDSRRSAGSIGKSAYGWEWGARAEMDNPVGVGLI